MPTDESKLTWVGFLLVAASLGAIQFSIFAGQTLFWVAAILWVVVAIREQARPDVPKFFLPLLVYGAWTLVSCAFSPDPLASLGDSKELLLFLMVPVVVRFAQGRRASAVIDVVIALGAAAALVGILQSLVLGYDIERRPRGTLTHWMTYSGVLMLVTGAAFARLLYFPKEWIWPAIAVPALVAALALSLTRNAIVGTVAAVTVLLAWRDRRLLFALPVVGLVFFLVAPAFVTSRISSSWDMNDPTVRDRVAMLRSGVHMVRDHPLTGVGPDMVVRLYPEYRDRDAVNAVNQHLHNVPMQIAAERGLPALIAWLWFVAVASRDLWRQLRHGPARAVAGAGVAAMVGMLVAGLFEYNFGDSEFLMLFLGLLALPYAAGRPSANDPIAP